MGERTSYPNGTFSWVDNSTTDQDGAKSFYSTLFGWDFDDRPVDENTVYSMAVKDGKMVGAVSPQMQNEREMGVPPHWNNYITVDDVDAVAGRAGELGGQVLAPPFDVMDAGRMAVIMDPTGAVVCLWQATGHPGAGLVNAPGALCWNELATPDPDAARQFFTDLFGWDYQEVPIEGMKYWMIQNGGRMNGGIREEAQMQPHWLAYFAVDDVDEAVTAASGAGAEVLLPKTAAGGENTFAVLRDPAGAAFGVFAGQLDD